MRNRRESPVRWVLPCRLVALSVATLLTTSCREPEVQCETFDYGGATVVLAVPSAYHVFPGSTSAGISLRFRYRDFSAHDDWVDKFDADEMEDPQWSIATSNYATVLQISRRDFVRKTHVEDFRVSYPRLQEVASDWEGWTKRCPDSCSWHFYLSDVWRRAGVAHVGCYEDPHRAPKFMSCSAEDTLHGLQVTYLFPVTKKAHFSEFRQRISDLIGSMAEKAATACPAALK
ncbi:MAG TPA: hypothetical protein VJ822_15010 [Dongiaceae bacterium]|nr:hypothetical protein [Dongiaceae bacterium]